MEAPPVPPAGWTGRHAVELYVRTYSTMLQSSGEVRLDSLQHAHIGMGSSLHPLAAETRVDMGALIYSARRLPAEIRHCRRIVLGQGPLPFRELGGYDLSRWQAVKAPARRRRWYYDGRDTLAVLLASNSDVDDLVPSLVAYQIEWNKLHLALQNAELDSERARDAAEASPDDWERLMSAWAPDSVETLRLVREAECHITLRNLGATHVGYGRTAASWFAPVERRLAELAPADAPLYFVSSNVHSLVNVLSGVARTLEPQIRDFVRVWDPDLYSELERIERGESKASRDNWLYFAARALFDHHVEAARFRAERAEREAKEGISHIRAHGPGVDSAAQIFRLSQLDPTCFDERIGQVDALALQSSPAVILNIDYPLGYAAYHILWQVAERTRKVAGVYVLGKAATLNADIGDVMIPNVVFNEHSGNTYWLDNCFTANSVQPNLGFGSALDNQRAVTVQGTFLQNHEYLDFYYQGHYTVVEMEAGPYLDACYELAHTDRHPVDEQVNMSRLGFDLGVIHYASDTPYTQARTLGARGLNYRGMDSTYASAIAVARRILEQEGALL
ncbi:MAG TPA: hypothetical protein VF137_10755 [Candidatus Dormibacteraeota bacterium]